MSAPRYSSSNYDSAAKKYEELANKYYNTERATSDTVQANNLAAQYGARQAKAASEAEGLSAQNEALNLGYSRSQAAQRGAEARANSFRNNYNSAYANMGNSLNSSIQGAKDSAVQARGSLMSGAQQKDANRYQSESNRYGAAMGAVGGLFTGAANALSDETKKEIHAKTDCNKRREELLARLRG